MSQRRRKTGERPVFDSIRKPIAPPGKKFGDEKPGEIARPSMRKVKHKKKVDPKTGDVDF